MKAILVITVTALRFSGATHPVTRHWVFEIPELRWGAIRTVCDGIRKLHYINEVEKHVGRELHNGVSVVGMKQLPATMVGRMAIEDDDTPSVCVESHKFTLSEPDKAAESLVCQLQRSRKNSRTLERSLQHVRAELGAKTERLAKCKGDVLHLRVQLDEAVKKGIDPSDAAAALNTKVSMLNTRNRALVANIKRDGDVIAVLQAKLGYEVSRNATLVADSSELEQSAGGYRGKIRDLNKLLALRESELMEIKTRILEIADNQQ